jgi:hypothetical protein
VIDAKAQAEVAQPVTVKAAVGAAWRAVEGEPGVRQRGPIDIGAAGGQRAVTAAARPVAASAASRSAARASGGASS